MQGHRAMSGLCSKGGAHSGVALHQRLISSSILVLGVFVGGASLLLFTIFLFIGPLQLVRMGLSERAVLAWDGFLSLAFFLQHSGMLRRGFRARLSGIVPPHYHGALFAILSGAILTPLVVCWQSSSITLYELQGFPRWLARGCFFLAIVGLAWGALALRSFDPFGIDSVRAHLSGKQHALQPFVVRGPYSWVRHPLYFFVILMIWSCPVLTADRLLFNVLWTVWVYVGTFFEEADLLLDFGEAYRDYQRKVPRLIPWRTPSGS
jgi:methanethiol S-methyltransferase